MTSNDKIPAQAATYYNAAIQDEINGFELTAAMEWQKAAELLAPFPSVANICWQQWERLTKLPRQFATPLSAQAPQPAQYPDSRPSQSGARHACALQL